MKYQKIVNLLDNTPNPPSKFKTKNCVKINDESQGTYNKDNQIKLTSSMLRSSLRDYSDIYIYIYIYLLKEIQIWQTLQLRINQIMAPVKSLHLRIVLHLPNASAEKNNTQVDDASYIGVVIPAYNL